MNFKLKQKITCVCVKVRLRKVLLAINISALLLLAGNFQTFAQSAIGDRLVKIGSNKTTLPSVLMEIKKQTGIDFLYKEKEIAQIDNIQINKEAKISNILDDCLKGTGLQYQIVDNIIVVKPRMEEPKDDSKILRGTVVDEKGDPLPGVTVIIQGTQTGTITDADGKYIIKVNPEDALNFSFIGMKTYLVMVEDKERLDVILKSNVEDIEEVAVVAFGQQKKESIVSAITTVKPKDLESSNSDLTSTFAGKIAGVIGWDTGGVPGALTEDEMNTKFYIRGITSYATGANIDPLILLDGIEVSKLDLARIDPDDIESFNVMKDASATAMYGARGANGVIYVTTKKGEEGRIRTSFKYERIYTSPTDNIEVVGAKDYMRLYNQAIMGRGLSEQPFYSAERIENTGSNRYPSWVYPDNNWYNILFKDFSINNHYTLNVRGGSSRVQYYVSANYNDDNGMIQTDPLNQFDCNISNQQTNLRVNINADITKSAKLNMTSFSTYDNYHGSAADVKTAYALAFNASPVDFAPVYPADKEYNWPHIRFGGRGNNAVTGTLDNPYAEVHKGYKDRVRYSSINQFEYIQKLHSLIKGLELRANIGMTKTGYFNNVYTTKPALYTLRKYDFATGDFWLNATNENQDDNKLSKDKGNSGSYAETIMDYQLRLLHTAAWEDHQTSLTAAFTVRQKDDSSPSDVISSLPYRNIGIATRGTYGYKDRYFAEASLGVNGSERFASGNRIGYFPAVGAAWIFSRENFMRSMDRWLQFAKFRASYGITGNDGVISDPRFLYLEQIASGGNLMLGEPASGKSTLVIKSYAKENTKWETNEQLNLGLDLTLFKGLFEMNFDAYQAIRHNIYDYRYTVPASLGVLQYPLDNYGKVKSRGIDFSGKVQYAFNSDFWMILNGTFTYNKATFLTVEEPEGKQNWQKKVGHDISQSFAYIAEGLFQDQTEIDNAPTQDGSVQPGDIRYKDIDKNGKIDINDAVLAGYPETPRIVYGLSAFVHYKSFEFSMTFQGSGNRTFFINPAQISPFYGDKAVLKAIADSHWREEDQEMKPFWPKLSINNIVDHNPEENYSNTEKRKSTYFMREGRFIRCKSMEIAYYLNKGLMKKLKVENFRLFARANNPFLISSFDLWDIELGSSGFNYPIQKTYSIGCNFSL